MPQHPATDPPEPDAGLVALEGRFESDQGVFVASCHQVSTDFQQPPRFAVLTVVDGKLRGVGALEVLACFEHRRRFAEIRRQ